ncbi:MAG TPA: hypothetical protein VFW50_14290 [Streptosporangiaceae bacterium]|nr:hypothetical protein [Streptosporangiaceae bacterium]
MYLPGLVDPCCHPSFCAAYTTGAELALADLAAKAAPASSVPSRTTPASSLRWLSHVEHPRRIAATGAGLTRP